MPLAKYRPYIELSRLNKPTGIWLLLWPSFCGLALGNGRLSDYALFFAGTVALRSAGCVINDMADYKFDRLVKRSRNRPLAAGTLGMTEAIALVIIWLSVGLLVWAYLTPAAKIISLSGAIMMVIYPFLKRITYWPQIFLGFTFNIGFLTALARKNVSMNARHLAIYAALVFWTLFYDTVYAFADIEDDTPIGVKSSAMKIRARPKLWLALANFAEAGLFIAGFKNHSEKALAVIGLIYSLYLIYAWNPKDDESCITTFKRCHFLGLGIWLGLEFIRVVAP